MAKPIKVLKRAKAKAHKRLNSASPESIDRRICHEELEARLLESLDSGEATPLTKKDFENIRIEVKRRDSKKFNSDFEEFVSDPKRKKLFDKALRQLETHEEASLKKHSKIAKHVAAKN